MAKKNTPKSVTCSKCQKSSPLNKIIVKKIDIPFGIPTLWLVNKEDYDLVPPELVAQAMLGDGIIPARLTGEDRFCPHCNCHYTYKDLEKVGLFPPVDMSKFHL